MPFEKNYILGGWLAPKTKVLEQPRLWDDLMLIRACRKAGGKGFL
jgi:hypothetical protein